MQQLQALTPIAPVTRERQYVQPPQVGGLGSSSYATTGTSTSYHGPSYLSSTAHAPPPAPQTPRFEEPDLRAARDFISRIPAHSHFWTMNKTLQARGANHDLRPDQFGDDVPVDIVVFDIVTLQPVRYRTMRQLRNYLGIRHGSDASRIRTQKVYLVDSQTVSPEVVGLLGSALKMSPNFWDLHGRHARGLTSSQMRPSAVSKNRSFSMTFVTVPDDISSSGSVRRTASSAGRGTRRTTSIGILDSVQTGGRSSAVILVPNYKISALVASDPSLVPPPPLVAENTTPDDQPPTWTSFEVLQRNLRGFMQSALGSANPPAAVARSLFPLAITEWDHTLSTWEERITLAESVLASDPSRLIASSASWPEYHRLIGGMATAWRSIPYLSLSSSSSSSSHTQTQEAAIQGARREEEERANKAFNDDLGYLQTFAETLQEREEALPRQDSGRHRERVGRAKQERSSSADWTDEKQDRRRGGDDQDQDQVQDQTYFPGDPGGDNEYLNHIRGKVDQIAYVTTVLLSMSFIATVYGMNLSVFSQDGIPSVNDFLAAALPFSLGVFLVTFGPTLWGSWRAKRRGRRRRREAFVLNLV